MKKPSGFTSLVDPQVAIPRVNLQSEHFVKQLLRLFHPDAPLSACYTSAARVSASARQAAALEEADANVDIAVRPLIRYYSLLHWMKALLHLADLDFPASTAVLQHGVSVRRTKRSPYQWPFDVLYVHKDGILQSLWRVAQVGGRLPDRLAVGHCLGSLSLMVDDVAAVHPQLQHVYPVLRTPPADTRRTSVGSDEGPMVPDVAAYVPRRIAANRGMTPGEWKAAFLTARSQSIGDTSVPPVHASVQGPDGPHLRTVNPPDGMSGNSLPVPDAAGTLFGTGESELDEPEGWLVLPSDVTEHPWYATQPPGEPRNTAWYGPSGSSSGFPPCMDSTGPVASSCHLLHDDAPQPQWFHHFCVLYTLSALCRYNSVEWSDILTWNNEVDALLVRQYLARYSPASVSGSLPGLV
ncbi:MAG: YaaC family protein [Alicyclobacillus sp.]|nr:YaaC family protein [Alicyclobacillus sp.]